MDKEWFIAQYTEIHDNLFRLEREIERQQNNKINISKDPSILEKLKTETLNEIEKLNKIREHERRIFNY
jgi:hypothetical protein